MYDCQTDSFTDFSFALFDTRTHQQPLAGQLTATLANGATADSLQTLKQFVVDLGYTPAQKNHSLTINGISLFDALNVNTRFGQTFIISCHLRRDPPVTFGQ